MRQSTFYARCPPVCFFSISATVSPLRRPVTVNSLAACRMYILTVGYTISILGAIRLRTVCSQLCTEHAEMRSKFAKSILTFSSRADSTCRHSALGSRPLELHARVTRRVIVPSAITSHYLNGNRDRQLGCENGELRGVYSYVVQLLISSFSSLEARLASCWPSFLKTAAERAPLAFLPHLH